MPETVSEPSANSVARFNVPGRNQPNKKAGVRGDGAATVKPRVARTGFTRFLTLEDLDKRTRAAQRARQIMLAIESDLGGGDRLSEGEKQLTMRAAVLSVQAEDYEIKFLMGQEYEIGSYLATCNNLRRMFETLGLSRRAREVPSLHEYIEQGAAAS